MQLAQTRSFSAVARREYLSQPALTKQIDRLEGELGVELFQRSRHGLTLTYAGEEFYKHASELLAEMERAENHMHHIRAGQTGILHIFTVYGMEALISRGISAFSRKYPLVSVEIMDGTGIQQIMAINRRSHDIFFSFTSLLQSFGHLETLPLQQDRFVLYVSERDARKVASRGFDCLADMRHFMEKRSEGPYLTTRSLAIMNALNLPVENVVYYPSNSTILIAVQAGLGFAVLPAGMHFGMVPEGIVTFDLPCPEATIERSMGWYSNRSNPLIENFVAIMRQIEP